MSYLHDLGIDCGHSEAEADRAMELFANFAIPLPGIPSVDCDVYGKAEKQGYWFVGVQPRGMGYGIKAARYELFDEPFCSLIKEALYDRLKELTGFRRARFGSEATDSFHSFTPDELSWIDVEDMIYSEAEFPEHPEDFIVEAFAPGYLRVMPEEGKP